MRKASYSVTRLQRHGYVFILPTLIFFSIFLIYPIISAFRLSLFEWNLLAPKEFVGFKNIIKMAGDPRVLNSFLRTIHFSAVSVAAINILAFIFALMLGSRLLRYKFLAVPHLPAGGTVDRSRRGGMGVYVSRNRHPPHSA